MLPSPVFQRRPWLFHVLFWAVVLLCYLASQWSDFLTPAGTLATYGTRVVAQIGIAYVCLGLLVPYFRRGGSRLLLGAGLVGLTFAGHCFVTTIKFFYLEPIFPYGFRYCLDQYGGYTFSERIFDLHYAFLIHAVDLYKPAVILIVIQYYRRQQRISALNEERTTTELTALKNQLNPHFLFNTLNNLYTLALKKSDATPTAIAKLSDILDHILYRCGDRLVPLDREVELLRSYWSLEALRYGDRVDMRMVIDQESPQTIPPLLLLTLLENAVKHGVSQETGRARIDLDLRTSDAGIDFILTNTVPTQPAPAAETTGGIGLANVRRQLDLLYPGRHDFRVTQTDGRFTVRLALHTAIGQTVAAQEALPA